MEALLRFLSRFSNFFIFLLLEVGAFLLIIYNNNFQRSVVAQQTLQFTSNWHSTVNNITDYFSLSHTNKDLSAQNALLQQQVITLESALESYQLSTDSTPLPIDTLIRIIPAKVVYSTTNLLHNYLVINLGSKAGIAPNMGVIDSHGVVGVVQNVSDHFSVIISALSTKLQISGKLKKQQHLCPVYWDGFSPYRGKVDNIPTHVTAELGDSIVTSGYSAIFPENILIGVITKIDNNTITAWNNLEIKYAVDFSSVNFVNVIAYKHQKEQQQIEAELVHER